MVCLYMPMVYNMFCMVILAYRFTRIGGADCTGTLNAVGICDRSSRTGEVVYLSGVNSFNKSCWCTVTVDEHPSSVTIKQADMSKVKFQQPNPSGCGYKLNISHNNSSYEYSCTMYTDFNPTFNMETKKNVRIQLLPDNQDTSGFAICLKILTPDLSNLSLTCNLPISTTNPSAPIVITTPAPRVNTTPAPRVNTTQAIRVTTTQNASTQMSVVAIIGGSVGGVCAIIAVMLILCCVNKRNRKRRINSPEDKKHVNGARDELPIIMENDLYVSSDDVVQHNASNDQDASSDQDATSQTETNVEYAVVNKNKQPVYSVVNKNKQPVYAVVNKHTNTLKNNNDNDGDKSNFMIGPDGDQYTIVNKD